MPRDSGLAVGFRLFNRLGWSSSVPIRSVADCTSCPATATDVCQRLASGHLRSWNTVEVRNVGSSGRETHAEVRWDARVELGEVGRRIADRMVGDRRLRTPRSPMHVAPHHFTTSMPSALLQTVTACGRRGDTDRTDRCAVDRSCLQDLSADQLCSGSGSDRYAERWLAATRAFAFQFVRLADSAVCAFIPTSVTSNPA